MSTCGLLLVKLKSSLGKCYGHDLVDSCEISVSQMTTDIYHLEKNTSRFFPHSRFITGFVTRLTRRVPPVGQEQFYVGLPLLDL